MSKPRNKLLMGIAISCLVACDVKHNPLQGIDADYLGIRMLVGGETKNTSHFLVGLDSRFIKRVTDTYTRETPKIGATTQVAVEITFQASTYPNQALLDTSIQLPNRTEPVRWREEVTWTWKFLKPQGEGCQSITGWEEVSGMPNPNSNEVSHEFSCAEQQNGCWRVFVSAADDNGHVIEVPNRESPEKDSQQSKGVLFEVVCRDTSTIAND
jgi:hypothetical protein